MNDRTHPTDKEIARLLQGTDFMYTHSLPRLSLPALSMADGPHGLRKQHNGRDNGVTGSAPATAFPTASCMASSWDPALAAQIGRAIGEECLGCGVHMLLGPGVNIQRNPLCGRHFEYFSEDPLLAGKMGAGLIRGVESAGVAACVKHFALNNQENFRFVGDSVADERAMREIYLKPFEIAVREGKPGAVMTAYNRVNGTFASEHRELITEILRGAWGFDGLVMSDWGGTYDRAAGVRAGEDLEMPGDTYEGRRRIRRALRNGTLTRETALRSVARIAETARKYTQSGGNGANPSNNPAENARNGTKSDTNPAETVRNGTNPGAKWSRAAHASLAADAAVQCAVLLRNDGTLPLSPERCRTADTALCVLGALFAGMRYQGSGSSMITPTGLVTHRDAMDARGIRYTYRCGYSENLLSSEDPAMLCEEAVKAAELSDTIVLYLGLTDLTETEGSDRVDMALPADQLALAETVLAKKRPEQRIVVLLSGGSPVELPFWERTNAILWMGLPGQCGGEAAARLLFGEANPSGKLAATWYRAYGDVPYGARYSTRSRELYKESVYVGYRYALTAGVAPLFPFGFGLSYTTFAYRAVRVTESDGMVTAAVRIRNTGSRRGTEIVQLYVKNPADSVVYRPIRELRAFARVTLDPGEEQSVPLTFPLTALSFWNVGTCGDTETHGDSQHDGDTECHGDTLYRGWSLENGTYTVEIAASSADIRLSVPLTVTSGASLLRCPYPAAVDQAMRGAKPIDDETFAALLGRPVPPEPPELPITLETRLCEYPKTGTGRFLYRAASLWMRLKLRRAVHMAPGIRRDNHIKGAIFLKRMFDSHCARTLSYESGRAFPYPLAKAAVWFANLRGRRAGEERTDQRQQTNAEIHP